MYQDGFNHPGTSNKKGSNSFLVFCTPGKNWSLLLLITERSVSAFQRFTKNIFNPLGARRI